MTPFNVGAKEMIENKVWRWLSLSIFLHIAVNKVLNNTSNTPNKALVQNLGHHVFHYSSTAKYLPMWIMRKGWSHKQ